MKIDKCEITAEMNLKPLIAEAREVEQALNDFVERLVEIDEKYSGKENKL